MIKKENNIIQSNFLIENKITMTKDETRLFLAIVSLVDSKNDEFNTIYKVPVKEFAEIWGMNLDAAYYKIKAAATSLRKKDFFKEGINNETKKLKFLDTGFLSSSEYEQGSGFAEVEISSKLKPYLLELKKTYTKYILENVINLSLTSAMRLYELLKQYQAIGSRSFGVDEFKMHLGVQGKYQNNNANLRIGVIDPAIKDINEHTDLFVECKLIGRGINAEIKFFIKEKKNIPIAKVKTKDNRNEELAKQILQANGITGSAKEYIEWILDTVKEVKIKNIDRYISTCLQNVENITNYKNHIDNKINKQGKAAEQEQILGQLELEMAQEKEDRAREYFEGVPEEIIRITDITERMRAISNFKSIVKKI